MADRRCEMGNIVIPVDEELYSTLTIGTKSFPMEIFLDDLKNFSQSFVNWHKQKEIEISYVIEGSVKVCVLEEECVIPAGNAFVIFPDNLHSIQAGTKDGARYVTVIFHPCLLGGFSGSFFEQEYYAPVVNAQKAYYAVEHNVDTQDIFAGLRWICENFSEENYLAVERWLQDIWLILFEHIFEQNTCKEKRPQDIRILRMIEYLRSNYAEKFSLSDMAKAQSVSRGECCRFFKKMMGMTISDYLLEYRIAKSIELLESGHGCITDIAHAVGFHSASNFTALFKQKTGVTPSEYRKTNKKQ